jgi:integrase
MAKKLTATAVEKLRPTRLRREVRDGKADGLSLTIQPSGVKSWTMRFRRPDGRPAKLTLGTVDLSGRTPKKEDDKLEIGAPLTLVEARLLASEVNRRRAAGRDVVAEHLSNKQRRREQLQTADDNSFATKARVFIDEHARPKTRRWRETARLLGLDYPVNGGEPTEVKGGLVARWRDKQIADIDGHDIHQVVSEAKKQGIPGIKARNGHASDARGRKLFRTLSKLFSYSGRRGPKNPCASEECPPAPEQRDRVLSRDEIRWLWSASEGIGQPFGPLVRLLALTGARREEVARMLWSELSESEGGMTWELPASRTKNRLPHLLDLPPIARSTLDDVRRIAGRPGYVFTTNGRTPVSGFSKIKTRLNAAMLAEAQKEHGSHASIPPWRLHDLRRTAATGMAEIKVPPHVVESVLNHVSGYRAGVAGTYNKFEYRDEKREALERWATHVLTVAAGPKVVSLSRARRS